MNEDKLISEQELDKVAGGIGRNGFEQAWADYAGSHCGQCSRNREGYREEELCQASKRMVARNWVPGQSIQCPAYLGPR